MKTDIFIRDAKPEDLESVVSIDTMGVKEHKEQYWQGIFKHYVKVGSEERIFLVAEKGGKVVGYIVGELRAWEFGSPPCGWVFALAVSPAVRELGIAQQMFEEICSRMKRGGVSTIRTMVDLENKLVLSFFRGMGMCTGRYIELEKQI